MPTANPFPPDDRAARDRFRLSADRAGARRIAWPVGTPEDDLAIDVARLGPEDAPGLVVLSGGLHGVEAPLGSAIQSAWLEGQGPRALPPGVAVLLLHALNPFGYRFSRRFNRQNIDLNRNFLPPGEPYQGSPPLYSRLNPLLNPTGPPGRLDTPAFLLRAAWANFRFGAEAVKQAVAGGQYDFPLGLFFGGHGPSETFRVLDAHLPPLIEPARAVVHLDVHTGLGRRNALALLVDGPLDHPSTRRLLRTFGPGQVEPLDPGGTAYAARGNFGSWCSARFGTATRSYDYACAEFGTEPGLAVVAALRAENRAFHHAPPDSPTSRRARARLAEAFAPADPSWRCRALADGLALLPLAFRHVSPDSGTKRD